MTQYKLNTPIKSFNTYVFDCDGVLLDSNRVKTEAFYHAALPYGEPAAQAFIDYHKANGGISRQKKFEYFFLNILNLSELPEDKYQKALNDYGKLTAEGLVRCEVLPGVLEFLTSLPAQAKKFVVSGGAQDEVRWVLEAKGLATFFDGIYGNPVDKLTLVKNLDLKDSDYPGIFFGDARYDHEVAKANGLDFIFLSAVSDFDGWEEYVESHSLSAFEGFTSLSIAAQVAEQKALIEKEQIESESPPEVVEKKRKAYFFGFPFSPARPSTFTGGKSVGPLVLRELVNLMSCKVVLISPTAEFYKEDPCVMPVNHKVANWDTAAISAVGLSATDIESYASILFTLQEMVERHRVENFIHSSVPKYQMSAAVKKLALNKLAFWKQRIIEDHVCFYINSNVPHLADDFACYQLCRLYGIPTAFPYRLPLVPGVSARLYIPKSLYNHDQVYVREGQLLSYERDQDYGDVLPEDLQRIYDEVVMGSHTLGSLAKEAVITQGGEPPKQFTPPARELPFMMNLRRNVFNRLNPNTFVNTWTARRVATQNRRSYKQLAQPSLPGQGPYIYYALHMQPEASSSPLGGGFADQLRAIRFLAQHLPRGWQLVVKEHPHQKLEERPVDFYDDILACPNVELVSMELSSDELQAKAVAIATLTGTAALEAWLKGHPALVLGHILFQSAPGIYKIRTEADVLKAYRALENGESHTVTDIRHYLQFLAQASFPGYLDAYIDPCIPDYQLDTEENEREIAYRLAKAIQAQQEMQV